MKNNNMIEYLKEKKEKIKTNFWNETRHWTYEEAESSRLEMEEEIRVIDIEISIKEEK